MLYAYLFAFCPHECNWCRELVASSVHDSLSYSDFLSGGHMYVSCAFSCSSSGFCVHLAFVTVTMFPHLESVRIGFLTSFVWFVRPRVCVFFFCYNKEYFGIDFEQRNAREFM